ncbi:hypothetical protein [uncultured Algoriphagus sp.]|uniref:hypothetical protein n=1 Tax=uncultured Algoriphagus sp. TaxID=417365 RepID=UPI0030EC3717|tara:strand:+ start:3852 stop:4265 length:414 start_codon:yes stop_codon:yes gene_type:complete
MKHLIVILFIVFCSAEIFAQNISGTYRWDLDNGRRNFVISLSPKNAILGTTPTSFKGEHCGVFENGNRMDCSYEEYSISLNKVSENVFTGTILSAYSRTISEIKVTYFTNNKNIKWEVTKHGGGTTYFPENVMMEQY